jgi:hypothetical protein
LWRWPLWRRRRRRPKPAHARIDNDLPFRVAGHDAWLDSNNPYFSSLFASTLRGCLKYRIHSMTNSSECSSVGQGWKNQPTDLYLGEPPSVFMLCYWCPSPDELDSVFKW